MSKKTWCVKNDVTGDYWSNLFGWVEEEPISLFSDEEKEVFTLPIEGAWELFHQEEAKDGKGL